MTALRLSMIGLRGATERPLLYLMPLLLSIAATSILTMFLSLAAGMGYAFHTYAGPTDIIVLPKGATYEGQGGLTLASVKTIKNAPMLAHLRGAGMLTASAEGVYGHAFSRQDGNGDFYARIRGTDSIVSAEAFRPGFAILAGRMFKPSANELIVGSAAERFASGLAVGQTISLASKKWRIVGVFKTDRQADNLELWGSQIDLLQAFQHHSPYKSVRVRLQNANELDALRAYVEKFPQLKVRAERISTYQATTSSSMRRLIIVIGTIVEIMLLITACLGAFYALRALVEARTREIGLFRSLGFRRTSIFGGFLIEITILALIGSGLAIFIVAVTFNGQDFYSINIGGAGAALFRPRLTMGIVGVAALVASIIGLFGGIGPAWRAASLSAAEVLR